MYIASVPVICQQRTMRLNDDKGGEELSLEAAVLALDQLPAYL